MNPYVCPVVCPVCGGNGLVTQGFYNQTSGQWSTSTTAPETCRTCGGTGIVGATPTHLQPFKSKEVETGYNIEFEVLTIEAIERAIKAEAEVERLQTNMIKYEICYDTTRESYDKAEAENAKLRAAFSKVEDMCVSFHEDGPYQDNEEVRRIMEIYDIARSALEGGGADG